MEKTPTRHRDNQHHPQAPCSEPLHTASWSRSESGDLGRKPENQARQRDSQHRPQVPCSETLHTAN